MIDYSIASMNKFLQSVDEDEKEQKNIPTPGGIQKTWFLTEQGLYEVLFQSRKPIAKEFKKLVKNILKEIRTQGYYMQGELIQDQPTQPAIEPKRKPIGAREAAFMKEIDIYQRMANAERFYVDTLAQAIAETTDMLEKSYLTHKLTKFMQEVAH